MKETIFKNHFVEYAIDTQLAMAWVTHFPATENMREMEFKEIILKLSSYNTEYQINISLLDFRELRFIVSPSLQVWIAENLKNYHRLKKTATIVPVDFILNLSVQQTMDEIDERFQVVDNTENRYFDNEEDALKWLLAN